MHEVNLLEIDLLLLDIFTEKSDDIPPNGDIKERANSDDQPNSW